MLEQSIMASDRVRERVRISIPGTKFTEDLGTILRQFSDLQQSYDNWQIHRTFTTILR